MSVNYQIVEGKETGEFAIQLIDPPFDGVIVKVGKIAINENEDGGATLAFDYDIIKGRPESIGDSDEFGQVIGEIIVDILEKDTPEESDNGNNGEDYSSESDSE